MVDVIGVLNSGSSSIKYSVFAITDGELRCTIAGQIESLHTSPRFVAKSDGEIVAEKRWGECNKLAHADATEFLLDFLRKEIAGSHLIAVGHRVAHGGLKYRSPVRVNSGVVEDLEQLIPLAPLHQPYNLAPISLGLKRVPSLPQVACFDTAFHASTPDLFQRYAIPAALHDEGLRRYGYHGISYEYIVSVLPRVDPNAAAGKTVVLHLGSGASMCAIRAGQSVACTMGFSSVEGLPMATRSGSLDPGLILFLIDQHGMDARAIEKLIYSQSGLLGVSGISSDLRTLLASEDSRAKIAVDLFVYRIGRELGSLAAALGGLDAIVFTAGIGEKSPEIRRRVCRDAAWLGLELDAEANAASRQRISTTESRVAAWVIPTNEELMIARHTHTVLATSIPGEQFAA